MILVGNKVDLACTRQVALEDAKDAAAMYNCGYVETSAKDNVNVQDIFAEILERSFQCDKDQEEAKASKRRSLRFRRRMSSKVERLRKNSDDSNDGSEERPPSCVLL